MTPVEPRKPGLLGRLFGRRDEPPEVADRADEASPNVASLPLIEEPSALVRATPAVPERLEATVPETVPAAPPEKRGWFQRLKSGLGKTSAKLSEGITGLFTKRRLDATTLEDLEDLLIQADLGVETATRITQALSKGRFGRLVLEEE